VAELEVGKEEEIDRIKDKVIEGYHVQQVADL
jgi:hypothetical protein